MDIDTDVVTASEKLARIGAKALLLDACRKALRRAGRDPDVASERVIRAVRDGGMTPVMRVLLGKRYVSHIRRWFVERTVKYTERRMRKVGESAA